ncbi:MAG TPA: ATP:cob(I)alamin adenosyltransferase [Candidatus Hydrogenedentes bacterium]|nr:ATP:cob(I)alamin adenosyltransferase [Candidatus Hydrogenedentota bacterium]
MRSQVTTRRGDSGESTAISGDSFSKAHPIFETCGNVDAVRAGTALLRLKVLASDRADAEETAKFLMWLIHTCFLLGSHCSDPLNKHPEYRNRELSKEFLDRLDTYQGGLEAQVKLPKYFISSAANELAALTDVLCTDVRRLERSIITLKESEPAFDIANILPFVNRLSDTMFMLARSFEDGDHTAVDYGVLD